MSSYFIWDLHSIPGMGAVASQMCILGHFMSIILFPAPPQHQYDKQVFQVLLVYFDHIHIWKVSGCSKHDSIPFSEVVAAYF